MAKKIKKIIKYLRNPRLVYVRFASKKVQKKGKEMDDEEYISKLFKIYFGRKLDLQNPKTFNEKMQWLKLKNRLPIYTTMVDKHAVKQFVSERIGSEFIAKELGCWNSYDEIDFQHLPNQFVLKTTHGCGGMLVCRDKQKFNFSRYKAEFDGGLKDNYFYHCREWPYRDVPPRIIAEELLIDENHEVLPVYKFFCFNGVPYIAQVIQNDKHENETIDYIDMEYNILKIKQNYPNSKKPLDKPKCFEQMKKVCEILTKNIPFVRCDLYSVNEKVYFSEFTFFSDAGFEKFHPKEWDLRLGELITLPDIKP